MTTGTLRYRSRSKRYWENYDPVLGKNEFGFVEPSNKFKIGNGFSKFSELDFVGTGGSGGPATLPARLEAHNEVISPVGFDFDDYFDSGFYPYVNFVITPQGSFNLIAPANAPAELADTRFIGGLVVVGGSMTVDLGEEGTFTGVAGMQMLTGYFADTDVPEGAQQATFTRVGAVEGITSWVRSGSTII